MNPQLIINAIKIVTTILRANPKKIVQGKLFKVLNKYGGKAITQQISGAKQVLQIAQNPTKLVSILRKANGQEIKEVLQEIEIENKELFKKIKHQLDIEKNKTKLDDRINKAKTITKEVEEATLSSSWLTWGSYRQIGNSGLGILSLKTKKGATTYIYPAVPYRVWKLMREAQATPPPFPKGAGTGAGSVLWKQFLRVWLPSSLRDYVLEHKKDLDQLDINQAQKKINNLQNAYYRNVASASPTSANPLDNYEYKTEYQDQRKANIDKRKDINATIKQNRESIKPITQIQQKQHIKNLNVVRKVDYKVNTAQKKISSGINKISPKKVFKRQIRKITK